MKTPQRQALAQNLPHARGKQIRTWSRSCRVVLRDEPAHEHARKGVEQRQNRLPYGAADVLEINVDAVRARGCQLLRAVRRAMVDRGIKS
jgi:hypothetical protein